MDKYAEFRILYICTPFTTYMCEMHLLYLTSTAGTHKSCPTGVSGDKIPYDPALINKQIVVYLLG